MLILASKTWFGQMAGILKNNLFGWYVIKPHKASKRLKNFTNGLLIWVLVNIDQIYPNFKTNMAFMGKSPIITLCRAFWKWLKNVTNGLLTWVLVNSEHTGPNSKPTWPAMAIFTLPLSVMLKTHRKPPQIMSKMSPMCCSCGFQSILTKFAKMQNQNLATRHHSLNIFSASWIE